MSDFFPARFELRSPFDKKGDIVSEFKAVNDIYERILFALELEDDKREIAEQKLAAAYDVPEVADLRIYQLSDVDIKTGRLIIGHHRSPKKKQPLRAAKSIQPCSSITEGRVYLSIGAFECIRF